MQVMLSPNQMEDDKLHKAGHEWVDVQMDKTGDITRAEAFNWSAETKSRTRGIS